MWRTDNWLKADWKLATISNDDGVTDRLRVPGLGNDRRAVPPPTAVTHSLTAHLHTVSVAAAGTLHCSPANLPCSPAAAAAAVLQMIHCRRQHQPSAYRPGQSATGCCALPQRRPTVWRGAQPPATLTRPPQLLLTTTPHHIQQPTPQLRPATLTRHPPQLLLTTTYSSQHLSCRPSPSPAPSQPNGQTDLVFQ